MAYGYDKNTDYTALIKQDLAAQDFRSAAIHEAQRNEKVLGENMTQYKTTSHYTDWLPKDREISSGMDQLAQPKQWSYDKDADPAYQAYRKEYLREADRATRDAMGAYAGMTGGTPSTAAVWAAQQAGGYQRAQLADKIPELMQADYNRFVTDREQGRQDLSLLASLEAQRAGQSLELQQWDWNRRNTEQQQAIANAMARWAQAGVADAYVASILGVPEGTSTLDAAYQQWQQQFQQQQWDYNQQQDTWSRQQSERSTAYEQLMRYVSMGIMPGADLITAAGLNASEVQQLAHAYRNQLAGGGGGSSGGSGGGSRGSGGSSRGSGGTGTSFASQTPADEKTGSTQIPQSELVTLAKYAAYNGYDALLLMMNDRYDKNKYDFASAIAWIRAHVNEYKPQPSAQEDNSFDSSRNINPLINYENPH